MRILSYLAVILACIWIGFSLYQAYGDDVYVAVFGVENEFTIFIDTVALEVTFADEPAERTQGLSGVQALPALDGKLFLFDEAQPHGIWMKDMLFAIDIFWIDENLEVIHIEENVTPDTFPKVFGPPSPARYVLETNAFFADTYQIIVGDTIALPPGLIPTDLKLKLLGE